MDVDLVQPDTEPMSPDTISWVEFFLLDKNLLKTHLSAPDPEPTATDLIIEFLSVFVNKDLKEASQDEPMDLSVPPTSPADNYRLAADTPPPLTRKDLSRKILALKTASALQWNMDTFESQLPPEIQHQLVLDLVYMAIDGYLPKTVLDVPSGLVEKPKLEFSLIMYHRWMLRFPMQIGTKSEKLPCTSTSAPLENEFTHMNYKIEKILRTAERCRPASVQYMEKILLIYEYTAKGNPKKIQVPVMETFGYLKKETDEMNNDWEAGDVFISQFELTMQINFDLCSNYFFHGQHHMARKHIIRCNEDYINLENEVSKYGYDEHDQVPWGKLYYATVSKDEILGYIRALNLDNDNEPMNEEPSLFQRLQESINKNYSGIIDVLQADNLAREIPMVDRQGVESDIQEKSASGMIIIARDLLMRISVLNAVRYTLEGGIPSTHPDFLDKFKTIGVKFFDLLFWAMGPVLTSDLSEEDWEKLRTFYLHLAKSRCGVPIDKTEKYLRNHVGEVASSIRQKLISDEDLHSILKDELDAGVENINIPQAMLTDDWQMPDIKNKAEVKLEKERLKKRLLEATDPDDVRTTMKRLAKLSPSMQLCNMSPLCKPIGNAAAALKALPRGFLKDFGYVVSGAARARMEAGDPQSALYLLTALQGEILGELEWDSEPVLDRLNQLIKWEMLTLEIEVMLDAWPYHRINAGELADKCKACILAARTTGVVHPRPQAVHAAWMCLVNIGEWESDASSAGPGELPAALCAACAKLRRGKKRGKLPRLLWDYVLSSFNNGGHLGPRKRNVNAIHDRDQAKHLAHNDGGACHALLQALKEPTAISVMLSVLAKLYNLLIHHSQLQLVVEYLDFWPDHITNPSAYDTVYILESISTLLERSLTIYPTNVQWLRLYGDAELATGQYSSALRHYLSALAAATGYFEHRVPGEHDVTRRAALCCKGMGEYAQAVALGQMCDEPAYLNASTCLPENIPNAPVALDAYYLRLGDNSLIEVLAPAAAPLDQGLLYGVAAGPMQLNASFCEHSLLNAAVERRQNLLRALAKQYL